MKPIFFIAGTDTGVGKTLISCLLVKFLRERNVNAAALKPVCSGGRDDARAIVAAMDGALTLDEINPWHFRAPLAPVLAARREKRKIKLPEVLAHVRAMQRRFDVVLVEGAGGLLSPLGERLDSRDLIVGLRARPVIVAPSKLGVVNHVLLTLEALPRKARSEARVVLMSASRPDVSAAANAKLLAEFIAPGWIFVLPRFAKNFLGETRKGRVAAILKKLTGI
ncbi:MAG: dethiobiotin synthase [Limisphaerales bacterium]